MPTKYELAWIATNALARSPQLYSLFKRAYDRVNGTPTEALREIVGRSSHRFEAPTEGRVLFFVPRWWPGHAAMQYVMATALRAEGYQPEIVLCGAGTDLCDMYPAEIPRGGFCDYCVRSNEGFWRESELPVRDIGDLIDAEAARTRARRKTASLTLAQCLAFEDGGLPLGEMCRASVARSLRGVMFKDDARTVALYRGFIEAALVNVDACEALMKESWAFAVVLNSRFAAEAVCFEIARRTGLDVLTYERGFRTNTLFFAFNEDVTQFKVQDAFQEVRGTPLTDAEEARLLAYESQRRVGQQAVVQYFPDLDEDASRIKAQYGIDGSKHIAVAYPNIVWDTAVFGNERAFDSIWHWLEATILAFAEIPGWELVIRIHPAEIRLPTKTNESMEALIAERFAELPANVHVIGAAENASSYALMEMADRVLVYSSTMGIETAMQGREVVTAAKVHYAELGFTSDATNAEHYRELLAAPPRGIDPEVRSQARRYANFFFYRFHVPVEAVDEQTLSEASFCFGSIEELLSGKYAEVEFIRRQLLPIRAGCLLMPPEPAGG